MTIKQIDIMFPGLFPSGAGVVIYDLSVQKYLTGTTWTALTGGLVSLNAQQIIASLIQLASNFPAPGFSGVSIPTQVASTFTPGNSVCGFVYDGQGNPLGGSVKIALPIINNSPITIDGNATITIGN